MVKINKYIFKRHLSTCHIRKVPWGNEMLTSNTDPSASHSSSYGAGTEAVWVTCYCITNHSTPSGSCGFCVQEFSCSLPGGVLVQGFLWGCSPDVSSGIHVRAGPGLESLLQRWFTRTPGPAVCLLAEAPVPYRVDLSISEPTSQSACPTVTDPREDKQELWCLLWPSLRSHTPWLLHCLRGVTG